MHFFEPQPYKAAHPRCGIEELSMVSGKKKKGYPTHQKTGSPKKGQLVIFWSKLRAHKLASSAPHALGAAGHRVPREAAEVLRRKFTKTRGIFVMDQRLFLSFFFFLHLSFCGGFIVVFSSSLFVGGGGGTGVPSFFLFVWGGYLFFFLGGGFYWISFLLLWGFYWISFGRYRNQKEAQKTKPTKAIEKDTQQDIKHFFKTPVLRNAHFSATVKLKKNMGN